MPRRTTFIRLFILASVLWAGGSAVRFTSAASANTDARSSFQEAQGFLEDNDLRAARKSLLNAVKADPRWTDALLAQARVSLDLFDPVAAQSAVEQALAAGLLGCWAAGGGCSASFGARVLDAGRV